MGAVPYGEIHDRCPFTGQALRQDRGRLGPELRGHPRCRHRLSRPQWLGEVDHHAHDHGSRHPDGRGCSRERHALHELRWPLREVGALLDAKAFHPFRSACNHLLILTKTNDIPRRRIDEVLDVVGLTSVAHDRAGKYSLGMGQRLRIAGALLGDPAVLLFDEPINGHRHRRRRLRGRGGEARGQHLRQARPAGVAVGPPPGPGCSPLPRLLSPALLARQEQWRGHGEVVGPDP